MKYLYAPWRQKYTKQAAETPETCVFCHQIAENNDDKYFIIKRFAYCYVMLNLHPYNVGHVLILPYKHVPDLENLSQNERTELMEVLSRTMHLIRTTLSSDGMNMGINQGKASGGSIPHHLHMHVIPRWSGDTNFLVPLADTKPLSFSLPEMFIKLKETFTKQA